MALGELTKQLVIDAIADATSPAQAPAADPLGGTILSQIQAMQRPLKEDQELHVVCNGIRVVEIYQPSHQVFVITGFDGERNLTRLISPILATQLTCRVVKAQPGAQPLRVKCITPKPKSD